MKKPLKIISVDGTRGSGKTSQINMLAKYFKALGYECSVIKAGHNAETGLEAFKLVDKFLDNSSKKMVILDGSIARPMVIDLINGIPAIQVIDKYKHTMHDYEKMNQKYGIVGLMLVMDNISEAGARLAKKASLTGLPENKIEDMNQERDVVSGMRTFNNHIASKDIKFHTFNIEPSDSIIAINKAIVDHLYENYDIPAMQKNQDDW